MSKQVSLLIWDADGEYQENHAHVALWQSYVVKNENIEISIPQLAEDHADLLRTEFLAFVYELGKTKVGEKKVVDHLEIQMGFSYWWMTLLNEKCNYAKSPEIDNIIKFFAFKTWFEKKKFSQVLLVSSNRELADVFSLLMIETTRRIPPLPFYNPRCIQYPTRTHVKEKCLPVSLLQSEAPIIVVYLYNFL